MIIVIIIIIMITVIIATCLLWDRHCAKCFYMDHHLESSQYPHIIFIVTPILYMMKVGFRELTGLVQGYIAGR